MNLTEFADKIGATISLRRAERLKQWQAYFEHTCVKNGYHNEYSGGVGNSPQEALIHYADLIRGKVMVLYPTSAPQREVAVPMDLKGTLS